VWDDAASVVSAGEVLEGVAGPLATCATAAAAGTVACDGVADVNAGEVDTATVGPEEAVVDIVWLLSEER